MQSSNTHSDSQNGPASPRNYTQQLIVDGDYIYRMSLTPCKVSHVNAILDVAHQFQETFTQCRRTWAWSWDSAASTIAEMLRPHLTDLGFQVVRIEEETAVEIVASLVTNSGDKGGDLNSVIVTDDKLLFALASPCCTIHFREETTSVWETHTAEDVCKLWSVRQPAHIWDVLAWSGDATRGIKGVPGVNLTTAQELVRIYGPIMSPFQDPYRPLLALAKEGTLPPVLEGYAPHIDALDTAYEQTRPLADLCFAWPRACHNASPVEPTRRGSLCLKIVKAVLDVAPESIRSIILPADLYRDERGYLEMIGSLPSGMTYLDTLGSSIVIELEAHDKVLRIDVITPTSELELIAATPASFATFWWRRYFRELHQETSGEVKIC